MSQCQVCGNTGDKYCGAPSKCPRTSIQKFQARVVDMIDKGNTGWHISPGPRWHSMSIEDKCAAILDMWDAPRTYKDFKDSYRKAVDDTNRMNDKGEIPPS